MVLTVGLRPSVILTKEEGNKDKFFIQEYKQVLSRIYITNIILESKIRALEDKLAKTHSRIETS
jgi:hypothetical protein